MIVGVGLFFAAYNFANGLHLVALTRLWATKKGSKFFLQIFEIVFGILIAYGFSGYMPQEIFPLKIFGYGAIYKKVTFFTDFLVRIPPKSIGLVYPQF